MKPIKPFEPYKIDSLFGVSVSYGKHEGWDLNGLEGGNTDMGTNLMAVADGEIVHTSYSDNGYGRLVVLKCKTTNGDRWVRYAHCGEVFFSSGMVKKGQVIATMGSSGNSTASHLHLDVLKKLPGDWRYYGQYSFSDYFEDPKTFFDTDLVQETQDMPTPVTVDFKGFKTSEETYEVIPLDVLKSKILAKDQFITSAREEKMDLEDELRATVVILETERQRISSLEQENENLRKEVEKLKISLLPMPLFRLFGFAVYKLA